MSYTRFLYHSCIENQKKHHKKVSFEEEYCGFMIENGKDIDERFFLKE